MEECWPWKVGEVYLLKAKSSMFPQTYVPQIVWSVSISVNSFKHFLLEVFFVVRQAVTFVRPTFLTLSLLNRHLRKVTPICIRGVTIHLSECVTLIPVSSSQTAGEWTDPESSLMALSLYKLTAPAVPLGWENERREGGKERGVGKRWKTKMHGVFPLSALIKKPSLFLSCFSFCGFMERIKRTILSCRSETLKQKR